MLLSRRPPPRAAVVVQPQPAGGGEIKDPTVQVCNSFEHPLFEGGFRERFYRLRLIDSFIHPDLLLLEMRSKGTKRSVRA